MCASALELIVRTREEGDLDSFVWANFAKVKYRQTRKQFCKEIGQEISRIENFIDRYFSVIHPIVFGKLLTTSK